LTTPFGTSDFTGTMPLVRQTGGMQRRDFIKLVGGSVVGWPLAVSAQKAERLRRVAILMGLAENDPETVQRLAIFKNEMEKLGWTEGRNFSMEARFAPAGAQASELAKELIALQPDVVLAHSAQIAGALFQQTREIPVVFVNVSDPIGAGFIVSLARPGGNFTGVLHYEPGILGKWLAMLKEIAPTVVRVALVGDPKSLVYGYFVRTGQAAGRSLAIELVPTPVENAADIERSIESFAGTPNGGLLLPPDITTITHRDLILALAEKHRLPAVYPFRLFVEKGGLISYGTDQVAMFGQTAPYVDRILRGAKPAELPVQTPTKYETTLDLKTAKALGLNVPPGLIVAADEVFE
jgi:putative tryptophan/tyrosine transport system substrate-binding protein